ncbi:MAG TPA: aldehyde reductase [Solirubrobacterales bacterium]|jgi:nucleoside-diphosphate-sugar epimerase|nr:aldehyde reductase [Solirubrobacterales bacterium]
MEASDARDEMVLVTGGSGFVGGWCVIELLRRGHRVRTTIRDLAREAALRERLAAVVDPGDRLSVVAADLSEDAGWTEAVDGVPLVLHVASPFPPAQPKDPDELIVPAREGTLRVLRAALDAGARRVVVTSSVAAIRNPAVPPERPLTEEDWTDPDRRGLTPYARSKTIAERAAWDLVRERGEEERLAAINPGAILGPVISDDRSYSIEVVERLMKGMPGVPRLGFDYVDVRDVADLEIAALTAPAGGGQRFIAATRFLWMEEVAEILRDRLGPEAAKVPKRTVPDLLVRAMGLFDPGIRTITGDLGEKRVCSADKARSRLGWSPRPIEDTVVDTARSLVEHGVVPARAA